MNTMNDLFKQARLTPKSVFLETPDEESVFFRGVKIMKTEEGISLLSLDTEFYSEIRDNEVFLTQGFQKGVYDYLRKKYMKRLAELERIIGDEISNKRNHKKYTYLKKERENIIERYNLIKDA